MTEKRAQKKPNRNAGFSLVELLIAVTILSIIVIPLMHLFLSSARLNVKSRQTLRATTVAQDIMEGLKAYDVDELQQQFNHPQDGFYVLDERMVQGGIKEETSRETDSSGAPIEGLYYFSLSEVTMQGTQYDALIKVDARGYTEGTADASLTSAPDLSALDPMDSAAYTTHNQEHNNKNMAKLGSVVEGKDGLYVQKKSEDEQVLDEIYAAFKDELEADGWTRADLYFTNFTKNGFSVPLLEGGRWIRIDITDSGSADEEGNPVLNACVSIQMQCHYQMAEKNLWIKKDIPVNQPIFTSGNFYVIFYPQYGMREDVVIIDNQSAIPLKQVIVAKQADETLTDAELFFADKKYTAYLNFRGCDKDSMVIRTNLGSSLVNDTFLGAESSTKQEGERVQIGFFTGITEDPTTKIMSITDISTPAVETLKVYDLEGRRMGEETSIVPVQEDQTDVIYDVTVGVYKKGAAAGGFPQEERVMLLSGSKND